MTTLNMKSLICGFAAIGLTSLQLTAAQNTMVTLYIPGADRQPLAASIVGNDATAATYSINCVRGTDSNDCGMGPGITLTVGPRTAGYNMVTPDEVSMRIDCSLKSTTLADCTHSVGGDRAEFPGVRSTTFRGDEIMYQDVTITAGALTPVAPTPSATVTGGPEPTETPADEGDDEQPGEEGGDGQDDGEGEGEGDSDDEEEGSSSTESTAAGPTATGTTTSTGGMPQVTGRVGSVLSGLAIALAAAAM